MTEGYNLDLATHPVAVANKGLDRVTGILGGGRFNVYIYMYIIYIYMFFIVEYFVFLLLNLDWNSSEVVLFCGWILLFAASTHKQKPVCEQNDFAVALALVCVLFL